MMTETPDTPANFEDEIADLATLISQARELVATGHTIDLAGLSGKIGEFCARIAADPPNDAESVTQMIEALVTDLNALGEAMSQQHAELSGSGNGGNGGGDSGGSAT